MGTVWPFYRDVHRIDTSCRLPNYRQDGLLRWRRLTFLGLRTWGLYTSRSFQTSVLLLRRIIRGFDEIPVGADQVGLIFSLEIASPILKIFFSSIIFCDEADS